MRNLFHEVSNHHNDEVSEELRRKNVHLLRDVIAHGKSLTRQPALQLRQRVSVAVSTCDIRGGRGRRSGGGISKLTESLYVIFSIHGLHQIHQKAQAIARANSEGDLLRGVADKIRQAGSAFAEVKETETIIECTVYRVEHASADNVTWLLPRSENFIYSHLLRKENHYIIG